MKIHNTHRPSPATAGSKARKTGETGSFSALLRTRMEGIQSVADESDNGHSSDARYWDLVQDGARLLDKALAQIEAGDEPDGEIVEQLQQLSEALNQGSANSEQLKEVEALLAVESQRLARF